MARRLSPEVTAIVERAQRAAREGRLEEAVDAYEQALAVERESVSLWSGHGLLLERLGRHEQALSSFRASIDLEPTYADHYNAGNMLLHLGRNEQALFELDASIALEPAYAEAWVNRGIVLTNLQRTTEALASFDRAIELKSDLPNAFRCRAILLARLGQHEQAVLDHRRLTELTPSSAQAWLELGEAVARAGDQDTLDIEPNGRDWYVLELAERALKLSPSYPRAWALRVLQLKRLACGVQSFGAAASVAGLPVSTSPRDISREYLDAARAAAERFAEDPWFAHELETAEEICGD